MKVDLEKLSLGVSPLDGEVSIGTTEKNKPYLFRNKRIITNEFIRCVIERWKGYMQVFIDSDGNQYEIQVKEIKKSHKKENKK